LFADLDTLSALLRALESSDVSRTMPIFRSLLTFARHGEVSAFQTNRFLDQLNGAINQQYSTPAPAVFELLCTLTPTCWPFFYDFGLFGVLLDMADRIVYVNKKFIRYAVLALFDVCGEEVAAVVGGEQGGFRLLCRALAAPEEADVERVLARIAAFLEMGEPFAEITVEEELAEAVAALEFPGLPGVAALGERILQLLP
jgi:hypothetical protein